MRYSARHHSQDDPGGLIREALEMGAKFPGPAEDLLLSWLLSLGPERDPPEVARRLLERYDAKGSETPAGEAGRLLALLRETAATGDKPRAPGRRKTRRRTARS